MTQEKKKNERSMFVCRLIKWKMKNFKKKTISNEESLGKNDSSI